jgi:tRNA (guanine37-N1)-methyltransferase
MRIDIITIFPEYFGGFRGAVPAGQHGAPLGVSLIGKAAARGDIEFHVHDLRRWAHDIHRTVDDAPFGGGPGMVMKPEVWAEALDEIVPPGDPGPAPRLVVPTPSGVPFGQARAASYAGSPRLVFACGRYEGIDARFIAEARSRMPVDEVSIGDYVLAGGEAAVLVMVEAVGRLLPGVLGNERSASDDSFGGDASCGAGGAASMAGLLEGPVYTRPRSWRGRDVPDVLLSGDHAAIERWRRDAALLRTSANRPDLIQRAAANPAGGLDARDRQVLSEAAVRDDAGPEADGPHDAGPDVGGPAAEEPRLPAWSENMAH